MNDKEITEMFDRMWYTDIIGKSEPLYSISNAVTSSWINQCKNTSSRTSVKHILLNRLTEHWHKKLLEDINSKCLQQPLYESINKIFDDLSEKYSDNECLTSIIKKIRDGLSSKSSQASAEPFY